MVQFSIVQGLRDAFSAYKKHAIVMVAMGVLLTGALAARMMIPRFIAQRLGMHVEIMPEKIDLGLITNAKSQMVVSKLHEITVKMLAHLEVSPKLSLLLVLLVWMLLSVVCAHFFLAGKRVALGIVDSKKASLDELFKMEHVPTWIGSLAIVILYGAAVFVGGILISSPVYILLKSFVGMGGAAIFEMCWNLGMFLAFLFWAVGFIFVPFVIIDNDSLNVREVLYASMNLAKGNRRELVAYLFVGSLVIGLLGKLLLRLVALIPMEGMMLSPYNLMLVVAALLIPVWFIYVAELYRAVKKAK